MDASPHLMAPTQEEEFKGDKRLASPQTRNSGFVSISRRYSAGMRRHSFLTRSLLTVLCTAANAGQAAADMLSTWFPDGVPGYDTAPGVTITSRLHPEQRPLGLRAGTFQLWPRLDESIGYTNP